MLGSLKFSILDPIMHANAFLMFQSLFDKHIIAFDGLLTLDLARSFLEDEGVLNTLFWQNW